VVNKLAEEDNPGAHSASWRIKLCPKRIWSRPASHLAGARIAETCGRLEV
jgi:hypothetical protein